MQDMNALEQYFLKDIKRQSDAEIEKLEQEQMAVREKALAEIHSETEKEAKILLDQELNEMTLEYTVKNSKITEEKNRKLMMKREELTAKLFYEIEAKLRAFVKSDDYLRYLQALIHELAIQNQDVVFYIGKQDEAKKKEIFGQLDNAQVNIDDQIMIGGFRMENAQAGIVVDETFDSRLEDEKAWFYANSSLSIR